MVQLPWVFMWKLHIQSCLFRRNNNFNGRTWCSYSTREKNDRLIWMRNYCIFWCHKALPKKWWSIAIYGGFGVLYLQRLHAFVHLWECLVWRFLIPMPSCSISFLVFSYGRNVACHGQENNGLTCFFDCASTIVIFVSFDL
jgi:hypothetical protein